MHDSSGPVLGAERGFVRLELCYYPGQKTALQVGLTVSLDKAYANLSKIDEACCRAAAGATGQRAAEWVGPAVPLLVKYVLERIGQEDHQSNLEELAGY